MYTIGELARVAGVPATTVRFYERKGLLRPDGRTESVLPGAESTSKKPGLTGGPGDSTAPRCNSLVVGGAPTSHNAWIFP